MMSFCWCCVIVIITHSITYCGDHLCSKHFMHWFVTVWYSLYQYHHFSTYKDIHSKHYIIFCFNKNSCLSADNLQQGITSWWFYCRILLTRLYITPNALLCIFEATNTLPLRSSVLWSSWIWYLSRHVLHNFTTTHSVHHNTSHKSLYV